MLINGFTECLMGLWKGCCCSIFGVDFDVGTGECGLWSCCDKRATSLVLCLNDSVWERELDFGVVEWFDLHTSGVLGLHSIDRDDVK
eukprot:m.255968 g.255968  ORF g.255968 m.255968 type:complete len:87 (-) comp33996_c0_seq1:432-692(-)